MTIFQFHFESKIHLQIQKYKISSQSTTPFSSTVQRDKNEKLDKIINIKCDLKSQWTNKKRIIFCLKRIIAAILAKEVRKYIFFLRIFISLFTRAVAKELVIFIFSFFFGSKFFLLLTDFFYTWREFFPLMQQREKHQEERRGKMNQRN